MSSKKKLPAEIQKWFAKVDVGEGQDLGQDWLGRVVTGMSDVSTLDVAGQLLKGLGLPFTAGSWTAMKRDRLQELIDKGRLQRAVLLRMLAEMEEHARCHVFLFEPEGVFFDADLLLSRSRVRGATRDLGLSMSIGGVTLVEAPHRPKIACVRLRRQTLVVKTLESKITFRSLREYRIPGGRQVLLSEQETVRRAKVARLHSNGLLEVRIGAISAQPGKPKPQYAQEARKFLQSIDGLIPSEKFKPLSLDNFKTRLWNRKAGADNILVLSQNLASDEGNSMALRAGSRKRDASRDEALRAASSAFLNTDGSSLSQARILWRSREKEHKRPHLDLTVKVTDEINEFYTSKATSKADYESVFSDIRRLGGF